MRNPNDYRKMDDINWRACLSVTINDVETDFEDLGPAGQNQILFGISNGYRNGYTSLRREGYMHWDIYYEIQVNGVETNFEILTDEEQEEIRWEIALNERWKGSFECAKPVWGEVAAYGS